MHFRSILALGSVILGLNTVAIAAAPDCSAVLIPTIEQSQSDYSMLQAYMSINAEQEYDRLKVVDKASREAQASYKFFGAEYADSNTREEFREKIRNRLTREGFTQSVSEAKAAHRRYLNEAQIAAWKACVVNQSQGGSLLMVARDITKEALPLRVEWVPQKGVGQGKLELNIVGGRIEGKTKLVSKLVGAYSKSFIVVPEKDKKTVTLTANIEGSSDEMTVSLVPTPAPRTDMAKYDHSALVIVCSGSACQAGDWGVGDKFPTTYGDCTVTVVANDLDTKRRVRSIEIASTEKIIGDPKDFVITKTAMHPNAYDNPTVRQNLFLCGYVKEVTPLKEVTPRRALLKLGITFD